MGPAYSFSVNDDSDMTVKRYEQFISGTTSSGYFDVEEFEVIIEHYLFTGRTKDGSKALELGLKQHPNSSVLQVKRAKFYLAAGSVLKAYRVLEALAEKDDYDISLLRMEALLRLERENEAKAVCARLFSAVNPNDIDTICLDAGFVFIKQRKFDAAVKLLEKGRQHNPLNVDLLFELAYCYEQTGNYDRAVETHYEIIGIDAYISEAWFNLGQIYFSIQDYKPALEAYDYVLAIDPEDAFAYFQKAHILFQLERYAEAAECYAEYGEVAIDGTPAYNHIAECYEKLGDYEAAIANYKKMLEEDADDYEALTGIAVCLIEQEKYAESIEYARRAVVLKPGSMDGWVYMAEAYIGMDDSESALKAYLKAIECDAEQAETLAAAANLYLEKLDYHTALYYYTLAYEQDKSLEHIDLFFSIVHFKLGNLEYALDYLQEAINSDENAASIFMELCPEAVYLLSGVGGDGK